MFRKRPAIIAFVVTMMSGDVTPGALAGSFVADFKCKYDLGQALSITSDANESYAFGKGKLTFSQKAGDGNDTISATTSFTASGDFTATVTASRPTLGNAYLGLGVSDHYENALENIFYSSNNALYSNVFNLTGGGVTTFGGPNSSTSATFKISRSGNVLASGYDSGSGFTVLATSPNVAGYGVPITVYLFLQEENGDISPHEGSFSSLNITSDSLGKTCRAPGL
jgi:hypothetical protein